YDKIDFSQSWSEGSVSDAMGTDAGSPVFKIYECPSASLSLEVSTDDRHTMIADYISIAGVVNDFAGVTGATENETTVGNAAMNGVLYYHSRTNFAHVTDGSSNTMAVSEVGAWLKNNSGSKVDYRSTQYGFNMGTTGTNNNKTALPNSTDSRCFNTTSLRYPINQIEPYTSDCATDGVCANYGNNAPLRSNHPGGVSALFVDGSVHFLPSTIDLLTFGKLGVRNDGLVVSLP
ncbi:DUF1559 family PulG-like putative transporter, partial [Blastopirellula marina]